MGRIKYLYILDSIICNIWKYEPNAIMGKNMNQSAKIHASKAELLASADRYISM